MKIFAKKKFLEISSLEENTLMIFVDFFLKEKKFLKIFSIPF